MIIRISSGSSPTGAVYYNENKVGKGEAERLAVRNYRGIYRPVEELGLATIAAKLEQQTSLNGKIKKPTFHASLSLAQGEKPNTDQMIAMADRYMNGLGYGRQPYVIYQHFDTDHPHLHIVSVRVDSIGKKIDDGYERERSNKLRQQIEKEFGLQVAEKAALKPERAQLLPVDYGKGDLKRDLSTVINGVLSDFSFSSFAQFNQLLNIYHVKATEVPLEGKSPGLVYSAINDEKITQGTMFKASSLPRQPTMDRVNRRINAGKKTKGDRIARLRETVRSQLDQSPNWTAFQQRLISAGVVPIPHQGQGGNLFGLSFFELSSRTLYSGSELGKAFTAGSLKKQLGLYEYVAFQPNLLAQSTAAEESFKPAGASESNKAQTNERANVEAAEVKESRHQASQNTDGKDQQPVHNLELVRQLLLALGQGADEQQSEHDLKKMIKKSRKIR